MESECGLSTIGHILSPMAPRLLEAINQWIVAVIYIKKAFHCTECGNVDGLSVLLLSLCISIRGHCLIPVLYCTSHGDYVHMTCQDVLLFTKLASVDFCIEVHTLQTSSCAKVNNNRLPCIILKELRITPRKFQELYYVYNSLNEKIRYTLKMWCADVPV